MKTKRSKTKERTSEAEVDAIVESQADDDSEWTKPIKVPRARLSITAHLAARAALLARTRIGLNRVVD